jgi:hypothetical protein
MPVFSFTLTEYQPDKPWLIVSIGRDSVELEDGENFYDWAQEHYPNSRYRVELDRGRFRWIT